MKCTQTANLKHTDIIHFICFELTTIKKKINKNNNNNNKEKIYFKAFYLQ